MAVKSSILGKFARWGFTIENVDADHVLALYHDGKLIGYFSQTGATKKQLRQVCLDHLYWDHNYDADDLALIPEIPDYSNEDQPMP